MLARLQDMKFPCCGMCGQIWDEHEHERVDTPIRSSSSFDEIRPHWSVHSFPSMRTFVAALKQGGGPADSPAADQNFQFFKMLDDIFPELQIYRMGKIQTSPGVEEIEGSPTEYYRTVGAMIALIACFAEIDGDSFGIDAVSTGERGAMSMSETPGSFVNIGNRPREYHDFCVRFAKEMTSDCDWWAMLVFLAIHDVGKSDVFRNAVNVTLPRGQRTDDHDRILALALSNYDLKERYLPSVTKLSSKRQEMLAAGFRTSFQLPQLGQGEIAVFNLRGLTDLPPESLDDGTLRNYMYHSIFDIAGSSANEKFIFPLATVPEYKSFSNAMDELIASLKTDKLNEHSLYFTFLYGGFKKAYAEFEASVFRSMCESKIFREETGLVVLRILALTRNTYKNPQAVLDLCLHKYELMIGEMSGKPNSPGPQIMLYYCPDMLRMSLGDDLTDSSGENIEAALDAMADIYRLAREEIQNVEQGACTYQLNVQRIVMEIKKAGKAWPGGSGLKQLCNSASIVSNDMKTEGMVVLASDGASSYPTCQSFNHVLA